MGNIFADALPPERIKSIFSAYLTEKEEEALRASFEGHYDIKGALNVPGLTLIGDEDLMNADTFLNFVVKLLRNNRTARVTLEAITSKDKAKAYFVLLSSWSCSHEKQQEIHEMVGSSILECAELSFKYASGPRDGQIVDFCNQYFPNHNSLLQSYYMAKLGMPQSLSFHPFEPPLCMQKSGIVRSEAQLLFLGLHAEECQGEWMRLYTSTEDGYDFENLRNNIVGYEGVTVTLIKTTAGDIFGAVAPDTWREGGDSNYGSGRPGSFLFSIFPRIRIYRSKASSSGTQQYFNTRGYERGKHGIGFGRGGGGHNRYETGCEHRVFIPRSMDDCYAAPSCSTFEGGPLVEEASGSFQIDMLEVWGCGGTAAITAALAGLESKRAQSRLLIERARKVDKAAFFNNEFDGEMFLGKTFEHRKQIQDR